MSQLGATFSQNDSAASPQTWYRTKVADDVIVYTNDTKRQSGHREQITFRTKNFDVLVGDTKVPMVQMNVTFERQLSTDLVPVRWSQTYSMSKAQQDAVTSIRTVLKDFQMVDNNKLSGTDSNTDDLAAFRIHVP